MERGGCLEYEPDALMLVRAQPLDCAPALSVSVALISRYVRLCHPDITRFAVVHGVSAGSAAAVLAANRQLLANYDADDASVRQHTSSLCVYLRNGDDSSCDGGCRRLRSVRLWLVYWWRVQ